MLLDHLDNGHALVVKAGFNLGLVVLESSSELLILWILLDGTNGSDGSSVSSNLVLEAD